jgi:hypothetical protein
VLQTNPFMVATAVALVGVTVLVTIDRQMVDTIKVRPRDTQPIRLEVE